MSESGCSAGPVDAIVSDLDGAIKHATEVAEREGCTECGQQHRQLAAWLKELKDAKTLLPLYREFVGRVVTAQDARASLQDMRCWWDKEKKLAHGIPLTMAELSACQAVLRQIEDALVRMDRRAVQDALVTTQIAIEVEALGMQEAAE